MEKRAKNITTNPFFVTPNSHWTNSGSTWYKNSPVGKNTFSKWNKLSAEKSGVDTKQRKITNHTSRSTIVSHMVKIGVQEQELIKISGHTSASSLKPYLQLNKQHHSSIVNKIRSQASVVSSSDSSSKFANCVFNNCTFPLM
jgi:integrase